MGDSGAMGGNLSHEYHYPAGIGDDKILLCHQCNHATNIVLTEKNTCAECGESENISIESAIEVRSKNRITKLNAWGNLSQLKSI